MVLSPQVEQDEASVEFPTTVSDDDEDYDDVRQQKHQEEEEEKGRERINLNITGVG